jgi:hypothetical protein
VHRGEEGPRHEKAIPDDSDRSRPDRSWTGPLRFNSAPGPVALEWRWAPDPTPVGTMTTSGTVLLMSAAAESCMSVRNSGRKDNLHHSSRLQVT